MSAPSLAWDLWVSVIKRCCTGMTSIGGGGWSSVLWFKGRGGGGYHMSEAVCNCPGLTSGGRTGQAQAF